MHTQRQLDFPIIDYYNQLNDFGKTEATKYLEKLTHFSKYTDNNFANEEIFN